MAIFEGLERKFRRVHSADGSAVFGVLLQHILEFIHPFQKIGARDPVGAMGIDHHLEWHRTTESAFHPLQISYDAVFIRQIIDNVAGRFHLEDPTNAKQQ